MQHPVSRRRALAKLSVLGACTTAVSRTLADEPRSAAAAVDQAYDELGRRFLDRHGVMIDFADLDGRVDLPTPEECRSGKPNALGWFQPIENGAMFNGMYLDGVVARWEATGDARDAARARRLMEGLLFLNSISPVKGFVARGLSTDGRAHYPMGSNDQTLPWFFGLWRYRESPLATEAERARIARHLVETAEVIVGLGWRMPAEEPFRTRGSFAGSAFSGVARRAFVAKYLHAVTGDAAWDRRYRSILDEPDDAAGTTLDTLRRGMRFEYARTHNWTSCCEVAALRALWESEPDAALKRTYAAGLTASATLAAESLPLYAKFDVRSSKPFSLDWRRAMMPSWQPQSTEQEAQQLAERQLREFLKLSPRRADETAFVREPTSAAWIVALCPDAAVVGRHAAEIERLVKHYDYAKLYYSTFFWVEAAWRRTRDAAGR